MKSEESPVFFFPKWSWSFFLFVFFRLYDKVTIFTRFLVTFYIMVLPKLKHASPTVSKRKGTKKFEDAKDNCLARRKPAPQNDRSHYRHEMLREGE